MLKSRLKVVEDREAQMAKFSEVVENTESESNQLMEMKYTREKLLEGVQKSITELQSLLGNNDQYELTQKHIEQLKVSDCNSKEDVEKDSVKTKREIINIYEDLFKALETIDCAGLDCLELGLDELSKFESELEAAEKLFPQLVSEVDKLKESIRGNICMHYFRLDL